MFKIYKSLSAENHIHLQECEGKHPYNVSPGSKTLLSVPGFLEAPVFVKVSVVVNVVNC